MSTDALLVWGLVAGQWALIVAVIALNRQKAQT